MLTIGQNRNFILVKLSLHKLKQINEDFFNSVQSDTRLGRLKTLKNSMKLILQCPPVHAITYQVIK